MGSAPANSPSAASARNDWANAVAEPGQVDVALTYVIGLTSASAGPAWRRLVKRTLRRRFLECAR